MNKKNILIATNLNIWSIKKGVGAPSFYKTLELYDSKNFNIYLYTTEENLDIVELDNIRVIKMPKLRPLNIKYLYSVTRIMSYLSYQFIFIFYFFIKQKHKIDLFYGYEIEFIPSLKLLSRVFNKPFVSRFQGTILYPIMKNKLWKLKHFPHFFSIKQKSNLTIMTDDGTRGNRVIENIRENLEDILFLKNGIDFIDIKEDKISKDIKNISNKMVEYQYNFISVSRLQPWKRLDRSIKVFEEFHKVQKSSRFIIVGDGNTKYELEKYVKDKNLQNNIIFTGGIDANSVNHLMLKSDIFLSHYELSNVGNPLWEAMNNDCLIVTIDNGDTGCIIKDGYNGIISNENNYEINGKKLISLKVSEFDRMVLNNKIELKKNVGSWNERMEVEYQQVISL